MKWMHNCVNVKALGGALVLASWFAPVRGQAPAVELATIRAVQREVLPEAVRITVEMDREVPFYQDRLENPSRLFFDLKGTRTVARLVDATFHYDTDVVHEIRLGRHPNRTIRIVLDIEGVSRCSVFTLSATRVTLVSSALVWVFTQATLPFATSSLITPTQPPARAATARVCGEPKSVRAPTRAITRPSGLACSATLPFFTCSTVNAPGFGSTRPSEDICTICGARLNRKERTRGVCDFCQKRAG